MRSNLHHAHIYRMTMTNHIYQVWQERNQNYFDLTHHPGSDVQGQFQAQASNEDNKPELLTHLKFVW